MSTTPLHAVRTACAAALGLIASGPLHAAPVPLQATDYERAVAVLDQRLEDTIVNASVAPHWLDGDAFWYQRDGHSGPEFVIVDAPSGRKRSAFDTTRLVQAARAAAPASTLDPLHPGVAAIRPSAYGVSVTLESATSIIHCDVPGYSCRSDSKLAAAPAHHLAAPAGGGAVFARDDDLWLREASGQERRLTTDGAAYYSYGKWPDSTLFTVLRQRWNPPVPPFGVSWSPDAKTLIGVRVDERSIEPYPFVEWVPQKGGFRPITYQIRIALAGDPNVGKADPFIIDVASGTRRTIALPADWWLTDPALAWSLDARTAYATAATAGEKSVRLLAIDVSTGGVRTVIEESSPTHVQLNSFLYDGPNVRVLTASNEAVWYSERDGHGHLYLYDLRTGALKRRLTSGNWLVRDIVDVDLAHRTLYITGTGREGGDPYLRRLYRLPLDGGRPVLVTPEPVDHEFEGPPNPLVARLLGTPPPPRRISPSGRFVVDTFSTVAQPPVSVLRSARDGHVIAELERADASAVFATGWRVPERFVAKAADGVTDLYGVLYFPPGFTRDQSRPLIDALYGGPQVPVAPTSFADAVSAGNPVSRASLAQLGFVVVTIDARGTPGRDKAFQDVGYGNFADPQLEDHIAVIRQLAARYGGIDLDRVGVYGHSFGGYVSARAILKHPEFYKVAVSSAGPHNIQGTYAGLESYIGLPDYGDGRRTRPTPAAIPVNWAGLDNGTLAKNLSGKLMLAYGDMDENALPAVTFQLSDALIKAGKSFDLVYLPNRTHDFFRKDGYFLRRMWDYFIVHLAGGTPPGDFVLQPVKPQVSH